MLRESERTLDPLALVAPPLAAGPAGWRQAPSGRSRAGRGRGEARRGPGEGPAAAAARSRPAAPLGPLSVCWQEVPAHTRCCKHSDTRFFPIKIHFHFF